jgi:hypothetical protein
VFVCGLVAYLDLAFLQQFPHLLTLPDGHCPRTSTSSESQMVSLI